MYYPPFFHFSPGVYSVIGFPDMPQVPMPTLPVKLSGEAKMLLVLTPGFLAAFV